MISAMGPDLQDYDRMGAALALIEARFPEPVALGELAAAVGLSPHHFQRVFRRWAGISPKRFQQYLALERAKDALAQSQSVLDAAFEAGLSGPGRLHDLFMACEAMTPGEYKARARDLDIAYGFGPSPFGECLVMTTAHGVCGLGFVDGSGAAPRAAAFAELSADWRAANFAEQPGVAAEVLTRIFDPAKRSTRPLTLLLKGTNFQIKVWEALLRIPPGRVISYLDLAQRLGTPAGARAVGGAVAANSISWLIPCHRVIRKSGAVHRYRWGPARKMAMLGWEAAQAEANRAAA
ncbi:MAG TPA: methylated-DNA--[protein]-cysteine S-methyltransferase [Alphaproteobacteria bacterium]|jgi:AraC family transcriptional regulator of adaptative response/methylated-DNA-[protein]-cysteine methyltransferase|nr:methylated-DNA--[protein]-cysteine S-methyltransferase [Alphaproteobacteria bacterium]